MYMFSISFIKYCDRKKENNLLTFIIKIKFSLLAPSLRQQCMLVLCLHQVIQTRFLTHQCTCCPTVGLFSKCVCCYKSFIHVHVAYYLPYLNLQVSGTCTVASDWVKLFRILCTVVQL